MENQYTISLQDKLKRLSEMTDASRDMQRASVSKENGPGGTHSYPGSPYTDKIRACTASRRTSKAGSLFDGAIVTPSETGSNQEYITQRFTELESKLEDYLDGMAEDLTQDLEREQQHLILMQEQVDKQGQFLHREVTELKRKLDGETTRRSFVSSEVRGTREAMAEQLEKQGKELEHLRHRVADLETPYLMRSFKQVVASWLTGCTAWTTDRLPSALSNNDQRLPLHIGECTPAPAMTME